MHMQLVPKLQVCLVERAANFYQKRLGFTLDRYETTSDGTWAWCSLHRDAASLMLERLGPEPTRQHPDRAIFYFRCDEGIDQLRDELIASDVSVGDVTVDSAGMKGFELVDPDGHRLWFAQQVAPVSEEASPT